MYCGVLWGHAGGCGCADQGQQGLRPAHDTGGGAWIRRGFQLHEYALLLSSKSGRPLFWVLSPCLSRACLGKMIVYIYMDSARLPTT